MPENAITEVAKHLGRIFRHLLPGVLIIGAARASHPHWFEQGLDWNKPWHLAVLSTIAVLVGNTWYVLHRYTVHQLLDVAFYWRSKKPGLPSGYNEWLAKHVRESNLFPKHAQELREHILFRSAQVIYIFIVAEVSFVFAVSPATGTVFERYRSWLLSGGAVLFVFAIWQYALSHRIDIRAVEKFGGKRGETES
jgi:hypothetical protein